MLNLIIKIFLLVNICATVLSIFDIVFLMINSVNSLGAFLRQDALLNYACHLNSILILMLFLRASGQWSKMIGQMLMAVFLCGWFLSWLLFMPTHQFLDIESVRFCVYNFVPLIWHILQTFLWPFIAAVGMVIICFLVVYRWGRPLLSKVDQWLGGLPVKTFLRLGWLAVFFLALGLLGVQPQGHAANNEATTPQTAWWSSVWVYIHPADRVFVRSNLVYQQNKIISWPDFLAHQHKKFLEKPPVIVIVIESLRSDILKDNSVMPNLFKLSQEGVFFPNTFPASDETDYAWPAILSSQYPLRSAHHHYFPQQITYPRVLVYDVLKQFGYKTAIFSAQNELWGGMRNFLSTGNLDVFFDATSEKGGHYVNLKDPVFAQWIQNRLNAGKLDDAIVFQRAMDWIRGLKGDGFFLAINMQRPHFPYTWPDNYKPPFSPFKLNFQVVFGYYPRQKIFVMKNRYEDALSYADAQIGRLVQFLKEQGIYDQSLIAVVGDHGEAFYEKGVCCHANELFYEQTRVPLVIKTSGQRLKGEHKEFVQTIDIPPTVLGLLGINTHPAFAGDDVLGMNAKDMHPIFVTMHNPWKNEDALVIGQWKMLKDYGNGSMWLFDLAHDPKEEHNVISQYPRIAASLEEDIFSWHQSQLDYYADSDAQKKFYPPKVVKVNTNSL